MAGRGRASRVIQGGAQVGDLGVQPGQRGRVRGGGARLQSLRPARPPTPGAARPPRRPRPPRPAGRPRSARIVSSSRCRPAPAASSSCTIDASTSPASKPGTWPGSSGVNPVTVRAASSVHPPAKQASRRSSACAGAASRSCDHCTDASRVRCRDGAAPPWRVRSANRSSSPARIWVIVGGPEPGRRQLQRQRQAVQLPAHRHHVGRLWPHVRASLPGPLQEQPGRVVTAQLGFARSRGRHRQRMHPPHDLPLHLEHSPAGRQHPQRPGPAQANDPPAPTRRRPRCSQLSSTSNARASASTSAMMSSPAPAGTTGMVRATAAGDRPRPGQRRQVDPPDPAGKTRRERSTPAAAPAGSCRHPRPRSA